MDFFDGTARLLQKGLDASWKRNQVISNNIANVDTPNFKASRVEFESILKSQLGQDSAIPMKQSSLKHYNMGNVIDSVEPLVVKSGAGSMRFDGNNVDIDNEMTEMAKNNLMYQTLIRKMSGKISRVKYAISEGKR